MQIILFIISFIIAFSLSSHISGEYEGHKKENGLFFHVGEYNVHIHHFIWTGALLFLVIYFKINNLIIIGILVGFTLQGLTYRDRFIIVYKTKDFEKIYKKFEKPHWGTHIRRHAKIIKK